MLCQHCAQDTKEGFPYCTNCGEWIGTSAARWSEVPGSWGNPGFDQRTKPVFLLRKDELDGHWEPGRLAEVPAATQRKTERPAARAQAPRLRARRGGLDAALEASLTRATI